MLNRLITTPGLLVILTLLCVPAQSHAQVKTFFLHHSTGRNFINEGNLRDEIASRAEGANGDVVFWDHDYNYIGLSDAQGTRLNYDFGVPNDNTDPIGLHELWTTANAARDSILTNFHVIAFKSCYYPTCRINSEDQLEQYKTWYREIGDVLDDYPEKVFIIMSPPALNKAGSSLEQADRSRAFANWLGSDFMQGRQNCRFLDLYDIMAHPDDGSSVRNMLKEEYERSPTDWHPNALACQVFAPIFADVLIEAAGAITPNEEHSLGGVKALYKN